MTLTHTITVKTHDGNHTDTIEIYDDDPVFKVNAPAGDGRERLIDVVSKLAYVLWEKDL